MGSACKGEMSVRVPLELERLRLIEGERIAIGGTNAEMQIGPGGKSRAGEVDVFRSQAIAELVRAFKSQKLIDRRSDQRRLGEETGAGLSVLVQQPERIADQIGRRLVSGIEDENAVLEKLDLGECAILTQNKPCQHIAFRIAKVPGPLGDDILQISLERRDRSIAGRLLLAW